jgi:hypothetical protein
MKRDWRVFFLPLWILLSIVLLGFRAEASSYTVKAGGGGNYTSISACAAAAVAGDTCTVYAGSYGGWTQSTSGSAGNPITFKANPGDTVTITSGIAVSSRSYITISSFTFNSGATITGNGSTQHIIIGSNHFTGSHVFEINDGLGSGGSDNVFSNNIVNINSHSTTASGVYVYGDRNRFENNEIYNGSSDCFDIGGKNVVVRNNYCHDENGSSSGEHIDFVQVIGGGTTPTLSFSLVEANTVKNNVNQAHFIIIRTGSGPVADTNIVRYNFAQNLDSSGGNFGGVGDNVPNNWFYNNTIALEKQAGENGDGASWQNAPNGFSLNNIYYKSEANSWSPTVGNSFGNGDLTFNASYSGSWNTPYSSEAMYNTLKNQDPLFANYPTDDSLQSGSPAKGAGVPLTTVAAGDSGSGTSLVVTNAHGFQPGWAGTQGDWIRIGASATAQITAINYSTNAITLASAIGRTVGNPVYLYKVSNGDVVLNGAKPDIGSHIDTGSNPPPPQNLQGNIH